MSFHQAGTLFTSKSRPAERLDLTLLEAHSPATCSPGYPRIPGRPQLNQRALAAHRHGRCHATREIEASLTGQYPRARLLSCATSGVYRRLPTPSRRLHGEIETRSSSSPPSGSRRHISPPAADSPNERPFSDAACGVAAPGLPAATSPIRSDYVTSSGRSLHSCLAESTRSRSAEQTHPRSPDGRVAGGLFQGRKRDPIRIGPLQLGLERRRRDGGAREGKPRHSRMARIASDGVDRGEDSHRAVALGALEDVERPGPSFILHLPPRVLRMAAQATFPADTSSHAPRGGTGCPCSTGSYIHPRFSRQFVAVRRPARRNFAGPD